MISDTSLGGPVRGFPETQAALVTGLRSGNPGERHAAFQDLCSAYWKPIYCYARIAWAKGNEEAKDLTQAFLLWLLESESLDRFDGGRGSFRGYLKVLLRSFVGHQAAALARLKRGGGKLLLSLNGDALSIDQFLSTSQASDPEVAFENAWRVELLDQAIERVKSRYAERERGSLFAAFEDYALGSNVEKPTYEELAQRYGFTLADVRKGLSQVRLEIRQEILTELRKLTGSRQEAQDEWNALFGA
jgi:RNA polymerase sigma-70 factor (ECF subfamily)